MQAARFDATIDMISFTPEDAVSALRAFRDVRHLLHCSSVVTFGGPLATVSADAGGEQSTAVRYTVSRGHSMS
jgi:hypothetical protein